LLKFLAGLIFLALIAVFGYYVYQETPLRPQIDLALQSVQDLVLSVEEGVTAQIGYSSGNVAPQNITVSVPKREALDWQLVGKMGHDILSTKQLQIEIVAAKSAEPDNSQLNTISSVISHYSGRSPKILLDNVSLPIQSNYTAQEVVNLTKSKRTCYSTTSSVCLFILFLPGTFESSHTLGVAFSSTSAIFMEDQFKKASNPIVSSARIAEGTITHEIGHLFGLVNLINHSPRAHEDPAHSGHSNNVNSVMYWAVEDLSISAILSGGPPNSFDRNDEADIADIKAGRL
jgi:hypothetical protein